MVEPGERFVGHRSPQVIPEPADRRRGEPAPWAALSLADRSGFSLERVSAQLRRARRLLASDPPPVAPDELVHDLGSLEVALTRRSAVLVALFEQDGESHVILTRRASALRHHSGEIALPGGRCEGEETSVQTALREAYEEVGLDPTTLTPLAWLSPIVSFASSSSIWPVVGLLPARPHFHLDPREVDTVFTLSLKDLVGEGAFVEERWRREQPRAGADDEGYFPIYFFRAPDDVIWGATARVLSELLCVVTGVPWPGRAGVAT